MHYSKPRMQCNAMHEIIVLEEYKQTDHLARLITNLMVALLLTT